MSQSVYQYKYKFVDGQTGIVCRQDKTGVGAYFLGDDRGGGDRALGCMRV